jgi:superfamily II DNA or RNA helicase
MAVRLEDLTVGAQVMGLNGSQEAATVVAAAWIGGNAIRLAYRTHDNRLDERVLYRDHEPGLDLAKIGPAYEFQADPRLFKLAAEALRIKMAGRFDPMLAVHTSNLEPLPHQIQAVYGELVQRTPLRYLLADDPGAGKTIMAGLYIKELMLRGDLERCLIVAPGGLVEQWQDELRDKFGLDFGLLTRDLIQADPDGNPFRRHKLLIARMDQLSRSDELRRHLGETDFDLTVVDEAHRMAAHYFGGELKKTKRYQLGELLGEHSRHFLLMTATPHAGKEEDFQLFLALLDTDRFEGRYRDAVHSVNTEGLMRRMVKEDLKTFEGKPLFPERRAYTVGYELTGPEHDLYEAVTEYVRDQMNLADRLKAAGEGRRGSTVGFALTVLQRRLASSPEAILKSLERRKSRLVKRRAELQYGSRDADDQDKDLAQRLRDLLGHDTRDAPADAGFGGQPGDDLPSDEAEQAESEIADAATAARTLAELDKEIAILGDLIELAWRVRRSGTDKKWTELRGLLTEPEHADEKIIIFTEHRDTLEYLADRIRQLIGRPEAVETIHGGASREARRQVTELFTQNAGTRVLVATDAAGEGLNLQRAHLMVNYDLPWNPNRIEQRFGRIHRIGQTEVCHLWNLVAVGTREGQVFTRLLEKVEQQRETYQGKVFDVLGEAFDGEPLRDLLLEAIRYGNDPQVRARLDRVIDARVGEGLDKLIAERAAHAEVFQQADLKRWRARMDEANARRLQPHYVKASFLEAFRQLGGRISERESGRFEIRHVPGVIADHDRQMGTAPAPVLRSYERVTFDRHLITAEGRPKADLIAPGHPLLDAVTGLTSERHGSLLKQGTILVDDHDPGDEPRLLVAVTHEVTDGHDPSRTVSKRFGFAEIDAPGVEAHAPGTRVPGGVRAAGEARYLDYTAPAEDETKGLLSLAQAPWLRAGVEGLALDWAVSVAIPADLARTTEIVTARTGQVRRLVRQRLVQEINNWDMRHAELLDQQQSGRPVKLKPETAFQRARDLERRLEGRLADLDRDATLIARPPVVSAGALIVPRGLLDKIMGRLSPAPHEHLSDTTETDRRAIAVVLAAERSLGREPREMPHNNPGYDIESVCTDGHLIYLEVKGRAAGAADFWVTKTEALHAKNAGAGSRLALVAVSPDGPGHDRVRYITDPFRDVDLGSFSATGIGGNWRKEWERGSDPV